MSGLYLIVWEEQINNVLSVTKGGWPHITVAYTNKAYDREELCNFS
jgi:hypothetical protein